ncbi:MAG: phage tail protein [Actinomycetota bacterium]
MKLEPAIGYRFLLVIDGYEFGSFSKVEGIAAEYKLTPVREGGQNGFTHQLPGRVKYTNIKLSRSLDRSSARLAAWFTDYQRALDSAGRYQGTAASIAAVDADLDVVATWNFSNVVPVKYSGPSFNANASELVTEQLEFAHEGFWSGSAPIPVPTG